MKIKIWGARGSIPTPLRADELKTKICQAIYGMTDIDTHDLDAVRTYVDGLPLFVRGTAGGNTVCVEMQIDGRTKSSAGLRNGSIHTDTSDGATSSPTRDETWVIDAGSGLHSLGKALMAEPQSAPFAQGKGTVHLFISHPRWDHIQGFPFFQPAFVAGNHIRVYGVHDLAEAFRNQQMFNVPIALDEMAATIEFVRLEEDRPLQIGDVTIHTLRDTQSPETPHMHNDSYSYRIEHGDSVFVYASSVVYNLLDDDVEKRYLDFFRHADALIFDTLDHIHDNWEATTQKAAGSKEIAKLTENPSYHPSPKHRHSPSAALIGVDLARRAAAKRLLLFHHEPMDSDAQLESIRETALDYQAQDPSPNLPRCEVLVAHEGLTLDLTPQDEIDFRFMPEGQEAILTPASANAMIFDEARMAEIKVYIEKVDAELSANVEPIIDLSNVDSLTTMSLKTLVTFSHAIAPHADRPNPNKHVILATASPVVNEVIRLGGYTDHFAIYPTVDLAVQAVRARKLLQLPDQLIDNRYKLINFIVSQQSAMPHRVIIEAVDVQQATDQTFEQPVLMALLPAAELISHVSTTLDDEVSNLTTYAANLVSLQHANIVPIHAYDQYDLCEHDPEDTSLLLANQIHYVVYEKIEGLTLAKRLQGATLASLDEQPLPETPSPQLLQNPMYDQSPFFRLMHDEALDIAMELAQAVDYAHQHGIIHGHLDAQQILLTDEGIKITGFGFAGAELLTKKSPQSTEHDDSLSAVDVTNPAYVAPERILGQPLDARVDLYALGVLLYQLFTGALPFTEYPDSTQTELYHAHLHQTPLAPRKLNPRLPRALDYLILKLLAKVPSDRYANAQEVCHALSNLYSLDELSQADIRPFIGRKHELEMLHEYWRKAQSGQGQIALIGGESGVGKSSLAHRLAAQSQAPVILTGHCKEDAGGVVYHPFREILQTYFASVPPELFDEDARQLMSNFSRLIANLHQLTPGLNESPPLEPHQDQIRLISNLTQFIAHATNHRPWFVILEDLQWADESSLELLRYLGRHVSNMALFIIGTYRNTDLGQEHPLQITLRSLQRALPLRLLSLTRFPLDQTKYLLSQLWSPAIPDVLVEKIYEQTGGNPLYIEEVAKGLEDDGFVFRDAELQQGEWQYPNALVIQEKLTLPTSIYEAVQSRIHSLSDETREVLAIASVFGQEFHFEDLVAVHHTQLSTSKVAMDEPYLSEWVILEHINRALERQLLQEIAPHNDAGAKLRFSHIEIHHVIYNDLDILLRQRYHLRVGETLEQRKLSASVIATQHLAEELAYHFYEAGDVEKALIYGAEAADQAKAAYANETAIHWYQKTIAMFDMLPSYEASIYKELRLYAYRGLVDVLDLVGDWHQAFQYNTEAVSLAAELGERKGSYVEMAWCQLTMARLVLKQSQYDKTLSLLNQSQRIFGQHQNQTGMGQVRFWQGVVAYQRADFDHAKRLYEESLVMLRKQPNQQHVADVLSGLGNVAREQQAYTEARDFFEEVLVIRRALGDQRGLANALGNLGTTLLEMNAQVDSTQIDSTQVDSTQIDNTQVDSTQTESSAQENTLADAEVCYQEAVDISREIGDNREMAIMLHNWGVAARKQGNDVVAEQRLRESLYISRELGATWLLTHTVEDIGVIAVNRQQHERALHLYGAGQTLRESIGTPLSDSDQVAYDALFAPAHDALGHATATAALQLGRQFTTQEAIAYALEEQGFPARLLPKPTLVTDMLTHPLATQRAEWVHRPELYQAQGQVYQFASL
ncbi:MAG: AAA family ATPase [Chloroflexota bacterium]